VSDAEMVRAALLRQWALIDMAVGSLDLAAPSRIAGWHNREVVAHLAMQPALLVRFLRSAADAAAQVTLEANLAGTAALAEMIDASVRDATDEDLAFGTRLRRARAAIEGADLVTTVTTIQGPIALSDYLRTRCIEAVVHGCDLVPAVVPDDEALEVAASSLIMLLAARRPDLVSAAEAMAPLEWLDAATGRIRPSELFADVLPLMT
jgi:hypothetical protein